MYQPINALMFHARLIILLGLLLPIGFSSYSQDKGLIDRRALVERNNPVVKSFDSLSSLSVGNGSFAFTVDATGLQTFPEYYSEGVPLGTQSNWGWHSFPNLDDYKFSETLEKMDFARGHLELYSVQFQEKGRQQDAANYFRINPHRLHLGVVGLELKTNDGRLVEPKDISNENQSLDMWNGLINSSFQLDKKSVKVQTLCDPNNDRIAGNIISPLLTDGTIRLKLKFPYPTGGHRDDACNWKDSARHQTEVVENKESYAVLERRIDSTTYFVKLEWKGNASFSQKESHYFILGTKEDNLSFTVTFSQKNKFNQGESFEDLAKSTKNYWNNFWKSGGAVDFSHCKDVRAKELERRVVLSQYLTAIQCAATEPPQETGLTYNSWYGKFHLEMHWWHAAQFALWNRADLLSKSFNWYEKVVPLARNIAERQYFDGIRWMKMTAPSGREAPSSIGSFLIWQQPHFIYLAELVYRGYPSKEFIARYLPLVMETAKFMASFVSKDRIHNRYVLKGLIPAQETLSPSETVNPPFELSYWHFGLLLAQKWRERVGMQRVPEWDDIIKHLSLLAQSKGLYLAAESAPQTYQEKRFTSDHMAVLGAFGILPWNRQIDTNVMRRTLDWVWDNWNWDQTWGWDYPMTAMCAARLGDPEKAVGALLMDKRTNTYLVNGHNYQDEELRIYLPGNGGLLTAIAMMCAGWDGNSAQNPGFPKNGSWDVRWEGLSPLP